jgi:hypothetical protein
MNINSTTVLPDDFVNSLVTKAWLTEYLDKKFKELGTIVIPPPDPELPPECKGGPEIRSITILNDTSLLVNFWGLDVTEIKYTLYKENKVIDTGIFTPKNDKPTIVLKNKLVDSKYQLKFEGTLCTGSNTQEFEYKTTTLPPINNNKLEATFYYSK